MNNIVEVRDIGTSGGIIVDLPPNFFDTSITINRQVARVIRTTGRKLPKTLVGRAVIQYDYSLVAAGVTPSWTFNSRQTFTLDGQDVDFVDKRTVPTIGQYQGWVAAGSYIIAEDDTFGRWRGNIYEKRTTKVVAL
jgi:hypothetical protein